MAFINKIGNILEQTSRKMPNLQSPFPNTSFFQAIRYFSPQLFVGGLSYATDENSLREAFVPYGDVVEARVIYDRESGRSRGFGFVSYASSEEASAAIQALDRRDLHGRFIKVAYAADQRRTGHGPSFSGAAGYSDSSRGNDGYEAVDRGNIYVESHGAYIDRNYSSPNVGNNQGFVADEHRVPTASFNGAFVGGSYGATASFNTSSYSNENADRHGTNYGEANTLNDMTPYDSVSHDSDYGYHHNLETDTNFNDQDQSIKRQR
ncbi:glycine-rich RNA-binding protein 4, mitochondrial-like isoform X2 [Amaranthus tricolor]|nr:glycine-rich RNA-binding protein 4, mitochondrial-like isoform X2 [Amaranthus tricolor]